MTAESPLCGEPGLSSRDSLTASGGRFSGPNEFAHCLRNAFAQAAAQGWPWMVWVDPDFRDWPLGERIVVEQLHAWCRAGRQLRMLARGYDEVVRRHPRFVAWRQQWDHLIECRASRHVPGKELPSVLLAPDYAVLRMNLERSVGWYGVERQQLLRIDADVQDCFLHSAPSFSSTTLGL